MATELKAALAAKLVQAVVQRGHTVLLGLPEIAHGPGSVIELPPDEARRLILLGFLVDSAAPLLPLGIGPAYGDESPVTISQAESR